MYQRRGGYKYDLSWKALEDFKFKNQMINRVDYVSALSMRFAVHVLLPNRLRGAVFRSFARKRCNSFE